MIDKVRVTKYVCTICDYITMIPPLKGCDGEMICPACNNGNAKIYTTRQDRNNDKQTKET